MKVYGIKTCGTYKKGIKYFQDNNIEVIIFNLKETVPTKEEMKKYHELSGLEIKKFFNTSGKAYRELDLKNKYRNMTLDEIYELLSLNGMLIKRPLVIYNDIVLVGYKEEIYDEIFKQ
ncbi:MAG: Spx/MgsR family RNA polymerase-binding regulatory protein [Candidatus Izimaplasma sp.]|nr:Spx/MgsR family RNA polymerase-binding regulatory protein [Candidatus Izimaplasma bacterium]